MSRTILNMYRQNGFQSKDIIYLTRFYHTARQKCSDKATSLEANQLDAVA